uniref:Uncharacterized protein n=1 Tax=Rhizophora mucronata TaxID=61149 RepID=A0A2P2QAR1_RHIMU
MDSKLYPNDLRFNI